MGDLVMKKYFAFFLCLIMTFSFTACNKTEENCYNCNEKISVNDAYCKYCGTENIDYDEEKPKATATIYISSGAHNGDFNISASDIEKEEENIAACIDLLKSDSTLKELQKQLSFSISVTNLKHSILLETNSEVEVVTITTFADTKEHAKEIATCLINIAPDIISNEYPDLTVSVLTPAS